MGWNSSDSGRSSLVSCSGSSRSESLVRFFVYAWTPSAYLGHGITQNLSPDEHTLPLAMFLTALTTVFRASLSGITDVNFFASSPSSRSFVLWLLYLSRELGQCGLAG
jgi:hypothetical protein